MDTQNQPGRPRDPEKFIGENLINKIGIGILVLGLAYFVKYAIDHSWIQQSGQVAGGLLSGGILIGIGHWLHRRYRGFSSVLAGGGVAISYITMFIGFQDYHLYGPVTAFASMVIITGITVGLSLLYDRQELTVVALLGGLATPFLASNGSENELIFFTYLGLLNCGILAVSWFKKWRTVNVLTYVSTLVLFGSFVAFKGPGYGKLTPLSTLGFASLFFLQFAGMSLLHNLRTASKFKAIELFSYLSNTFFYFAIGFSLLPQISSTPLLGYFTAALGALHIGLAIALSRFPTTDTNLRYLMIGLAVSLVSLVGPVHFDGQAITLFWAVETALLLWLWGRTGFQFFKWASQGLALLTFLGLIVDWTKGYSQALDTVVFHSTYLTSMGVVLAFFGGWLLHRRLFKGLEHNTMLYPVLGGIVLYLVNLFELVVQLEIHGAAFQLQAYTLLGFHLLLFLPVQLYLRRSQLDIMQFCNLLGSGLALLVGLLIHLEWKSDASLASIPSIAVHYAALGLLTATTFLGIKALNGRNNPLAEISAAGHWILAFFLIFYASMELDYLVIQLLGPSISLRYVLQQTHIIGYPILWGLVAFGLMLWGMRQRIRNLRMISLTLFGFILLKLFLFDLRHISEPGRIAAFIALGTLLLVVSFLYQKLRHLILESPENPTPTTPLNPDVSVVEPINE